MNLVLLLTPQINLKFLKTNLLVFPRFFLFKKLKVKFINKIFRAKTKSYIKIYLCEDL